VLELGKLSMPRLKREEIRVVVLLTIHAIDVVKSLPQSARAKRKV